MRKLVSKLVLVSLATSSYYSSMALAQVSPTITPVKYFDIDPLNPAKKLQPPPVILGGALLEFDFVPNGSYYNYQVSLAGRISSYVDGAPSSYTECQIFKKSNIRDIQYYSITTAIVGHMGSKCPISLIFHTENNGSWNQFSNQDTVIVLQNGEIPFAGYTTIEIPKVSDWEMPK